MVASIASRALSFSTLIRSLSSPLRIGAPRTANRSSRSHTTSKRSSSGSVAPASLSDANRALAFFRARAVVAGARDPCSIFSRRSHIASNVSDFGVNFLAAGREPPVTSGAPSRATM
eukprot:5842810-Prymnesium_polylepis.2